MLLSFCVLLAVVYTAGCRNRETSFASPEEAAHILENCGGDTCAQLSGSLHLALPLRPKVCSVVATWGEFETNSDDALLQIQCSMDFELVLLTRDSDGRWHGADSMPFPVGDYDAIAVGLKRLIDKNYDAITIHDDTVSYGTGLYQADFLVLQISNRKLHVVLDTVEKGAFHPPEGEGLNHWVEQRSSLDITSATEKEPGSVTEMMDLDVGGKKAAMEREYHWQKDLGIFEPSFWSRPETPDAAK